MSWCAAKHGGRSVYENIGATQRDGAELGVTPPAGLRNGIAYSYLRAVVA